MKKFVLSGLIIFLFGATLLLGKIEYDKKLKLTVEHAHAELEVYKAKLEEEKRQAQERERERIEKLVMNLQSPLREKVLNGLAKNEPLNVVAMGSRALSGEKGIVTWPNLLQDQVNDAYGLKIFNVTTLDFGTKNTFEIVRNDKHLEVAKLKPDILILEPFIWNDNGYARIEDTIYHIGVMVREAKRENEDISIFIQPPNPLFGANFFQQQVERVREYSILNNLAYLDHWEAWPNNDDETLKEFIIEGDTIPNQEGHSLWADYLAKMFAAK
jgi:hypothetical protein